MDYCRCGNAFGEWLAHLKALKHQTRISILASESLPVEIFKERNRVFSRQAGELLEARNIKCLPAQLPHSAAQSFESTIMNERSIHTYFDQCSLAEQKRYEPAHLALFKTEFCRNFR
jgi:hypothetical protein